MYVTGNPRTKKELREWIAQGKKLTLFAPGLGYPVRNGIETVKGPQYPKPHSWYAQVEVKDGYVVKVLS